MLAAEASASVAHIVALRVVAIDSTTAPAITLLARRWQVPVSVPAEGLDRDQLAAVGSIFGVAGARLCIGHGTNLADALALTADIATAGATGSLGLCWEVRPSIERLDDAGAVLLAARTQLGLVRLYGGGAGTARPGRPGDRVAADRSCALPVFGPDRAGAQCTGAPAALARLARVEKAHRLREWTRCAGDRARCARGRAEGPTRDDSRRLPAPAGRCDPETHRRSRSELHVLHARSHGASGQFRLRYNRARSRHLARRSATYIAPGAPDAPVP